MRFDSGWEGDKDRRQGKDVPMIVKAATQVRLMTPESKGGKTRIPE